MKILWLKSELLHPVDKGGKIRSYQMLKQLKREHEITYLALTRQADHRESFERAGEYCNRLITLPWREADRYSARFYRELAFNLSSPLPYAIQKYRSAQMERAIEGELGEGNYDAVVCDFLVPSINLPSTSPCLRVLFQHNVESLIWQRHYETERNPLKKAYMFAQWQKMLRYEREACRKFDVVIAVSGVDRDLMRDEFGLREVYDVPTGVDTDFFRPLGGPADPMELVFTGSMDWLPNEDAIIYFAEEILPLINRSLPGVRLTVVGRNPSRRLKAIAGAFPQISLTGRVEDIRPFVDRAAAFIVPIRIGGGTRLKIYEAMAMGKPVISTAIGAEGLPVRDGEDLLIADEPEAFAQAVTGVLADSALRARLAREARSAVCDRFGWKRAATVFADVCRRAAQNGSSTRAA